MGDVECGMGRVGCRVGSGGLGLQGVECGVS